MGRAPLLLPFAALIAGIVAEGWCDLWSGTVILALAAGYVAYYFRRYATGVFLIFFALGYCVANIHKPNDAAALGWHSYAGEVKALSEASTSGRNVVVKISMVDSVRVRPFAMRLHLLSERPYFTAGQLIEFSCELRALKSPPAIPDIIDLSATLRQRGVVAYGNVERENLKVTGNAVGLMAAGRRLNAECRLRLMQCDLSGGSIAMLDAMLFGNDELLGDGDRQIYSAAGLAHLLALSGMHVGIIAMIVSFALWPLYVGRHNRTRLTLVMVALWAYGILTGFAPSVARAIIMATVYMAGRILERHSVSINSLCLAGMLILLFNPADLYSAGFQLSFSAVAGIILFFPLLNRVDRRSHPVLYRVVSAPALSVSAMILSGIVAAFHFHSYPLLFLMSNLAVTPIVPIFVTSGAIVFVLHLAGVNLPAAGELVEIAGNAINEVARITSQLPFSSADSLYPPSWFVIAVWLSLAGLAAATHVRHFAAKVACMMAFAGATIALAVAAPPSNSTDETFVVNDYRHTHMIRRTGAELTFFTTSQVEQEREELRALYSRMLTDYMALRGIDSMKSAPVNVWPAKVIGGDTFAVFPDSCKAPATVVYRRL